MIYLLNIMIVGSGGAVWWG